MATSTPSRVLISDKLESGGLELLRQAGIELDERSGLSGPALQEALQAADGVIVRSGTRLSAELLERSGMNMMAMNRSRWTMIDTRKPSRTDSAP